MYQHLLMHIRGTFFLHVSPYKQCDFFTLPLFKENGTLHALMMAAALVNK